jgi:hypothetical protein
VDRPAAHASPVAYHRRHHRLVALGAPEGVGLARMNVGQGLLADERRIVDVLELQLVVPEVLLKQVRALFEDHDFEASGRELLRHDATRRACAHYHKVNRSSGVVSGHRSSAALNSSRQAVTLLVISPELSAFAQILYPTQ